MSGRFTVGILTGTSLFLGGLYGTYQYHLMTSFEGNFQQLIKDRKMFFELHEELAWKLDDTMDNYESQYLIRKYRKSLCNLATGKVLETGVGTSRNIFNYPIDTEIQAIDYSPQCIEKAMEKPTGETKISYKLMDVTKLDYPDNHFDTIVDTFGQEFYVNPRRALMEMQRVCKKDGLILQLNNGISETDWYNMYLRYSVPMTVSKYGYFPNRKWDKLMEDMGFNVITQKRFLRGTQYYTVIKNDRDDIVFSKRILEKQAQKTE